MLPEHLRFLRWTGIYGVNAFLKVCVLLFILSSTTGVIFTDSFMCPHFRQQFLISVSDFGEQVHIYIYRNHFINSAYPRSSSFQILLIFNCGNLLCSHSS